MTKRSPRCLKARTSRVVTDMGSRLLPSARRSSGSVYVRRPDPRWTSMSEVGRTMHVGAGPATGRPRSAASGAAASMEAPLLLPRGAVQSRGGGMRTYEIMLILPAEADDAAVTAVVDRITKVIGASGG